MSSQNDDAVEPWIALGLLAFWALGILIWVTIE
jgi:hypothetical protein